MKKLLSLVATIMIAATTFAQVDEVTLTVIGTGPTEAKATSQALLSAIEQSFGTFVSKNKKILDDELVQEEIVSHTRGNVKEYTKLAVAALPNGQMSVSVKATVSVNKLVEYAKSKGSSAEFAGQAYAANVKLIKLRAESAEKTYDLMAQQLEEIAKDMFDFQLSIGNPERFTQEGFERYKFPCEVQIYSNVASTNFYKLYNSTLKELRLSSDDEALFNREKIQCGNANIYYYPQVLGSGRAGKSDVTLEELFKPGYGHTEKLTVLLPISQSKLFAYDKRLRDAIFKALRRYQIQEIGVPRNYYKFVPGEQAWGVKCWGYKETNAGVRKYEMAWYSNLFREYVHYYYNPSKERIYSQDSRELINSKFALNETKTPIKLTKEQKRAAKKGDYAGPTFKISYENPQLLWTQKLLVGLPASQIERCKGFELVVK